MSDNSSVRGILKKDSPREAPATTTATNTTTSPNIHSSKHLKWDENNLAETEANRSATMKITEPKTPFVHGTTIEGFDDDEDHHYESASSPTIIPGLHLGSDSEGSSVHFSSSAEWESSEELDNQALSPEERSRRRERFRLMRREHYRMKEALKKGRALVQSESDQDDDGVGERKRTVNGHIGDGNYDDDNDVNHGNYQ